MVVLALVQFNYLYNLLIFNNLTEINEMILTEKNLKRDHHPLGALALRCKNKISQRVFSCLESSHYLRN